MDAAAPRQTLRPPVTSVGPIGWVRANLFNGWVNSLLTLAVLWLLWKAVPPLIEWAVISAHFGTTAEACRGVPGACWSFVAANARFILFGFYPFEQQWRPAAAVALFLAMVLLTRNRRLWKRPFALAWVAALLVIGTLMRGGIFGLPPVETEKWSGLPLTMMLAVVGVVAGYPCGILLALGRRSKMPIVRAVSVCYIELIRGVPLISLLFMASVMFPLFLPEGLTVNKILRAQVAIIMNAAAYLAEIIRGGLQAMPRGQYEAAQSIGLSYTLTMRLVILPQALKIVIPPTVNTFISVFKDTSLVVIIALFDLLKTTQAALSNPAWMGFSTEAYIFVALIYFPFCFAMSRESQRLERELKR